MTTRKPKQPVAVVCARGGRCKGTHPTICETHGCAIEVARAAAADKEARQSHAGPRSTAAPGSPSLAWTVEKPRASGVWWWWNLDPKCEPDIVEVRASDVLSWCGLGPTMHWPGLTCVRNVMTVGGVWAGPVKPPETPGAETTANDKLSDAGGEP